MTPTELAAIDRLVAEKIMDYEIKAMHDKKPYAYGSKDSDQCIFDYHPTRNIAQAMEVLIMVREDVSCSVVYDIEYGHEGRTGWNCSFDGVCENIFAETASLAICLAALKTRGVEIPGDGK